MITVRVNVIVDKFNGIDASEVYVDDLINMIKLEQNLTEEPRGDISVYNSLRKYILNHNLRISVKLRGGRVMLIRNEAVGTD